MTACESSLVTKSISASQSIAPWTKTTKVVRWFLLTNRQFQEVGRCRRHIFGPILPKFYVEFENIDSSCDNLRPFRN